MEENTKVLHEGYGPTGEQLRCGYVSGSTPFLVASAELWRNKRSIAWARTANPVLRPAEFAWYSVGPPRNKMG